MKPRFYRQAIPLGGTLGKVEAEAGAALLLFALHELGRGWTAPIALTELGELAGAALDAGTEPIRTWASNPFLFPDLAELERRGFAVRGDSPRGATLALTPAAIERLAAHLVLTEDAPAPAPAAVREVHA
jgi:hypothetical protein